MGCGRVRSWKESAQECVRVRESGVCERIGGERQKVESVAKSRERKKCLVRANMTSDIWHGPLVTPPCWEPDRRWTCSRFLSLLHFHTHTQHTTSNTHTHPQHPSPPLTITVIAENNVQAFSYRLDPLRRKSEASLLGSRSEMASVIRRDTALSLSPLQATPMHRQCILLHTFWHPISQQCVFVVGGDTPGRFLIYNAVLFGQPLRFRRWETCSPSTNPLSPPS